MNFDLRPGSYRPPSARVGTGREGWVANFFPAPFQPLRSARMHPDARALLTRLAMRPIPGEGGWLRETWRSALTVPGGDEAGLDRDRPAGTAILALFCDDPAGFSALHRLPVDEIWHFCSGDPFTLCLLHPDGGSEDVVLGPDVLGRQAPQAVVPAGTWMGGSAAPGGRFALIACTMAPGFSEGDCELGQRADLLRTHPDRSPDVIRLTRGDLD